MVTAWKGTTRECIERFFTEKIQDNHEAWRDFVTDFMLCGNENFKRWFIKRGNLSGMNILRVRVLCELVGYCPTEFVKLDSNLQGTARLIGLGVVDPAVVVGLLDLVGGQDTLLKILLGKRGIGNERLAKLIDLNEKYSAQVKTKRAEWLEKMPKMASKVISAPASAPVSCSGQKVTNGHLVLDKTKVVEILAAQVKAMLPLAELVVSDEFSPMERKLLRVLTANGLSHAVFDLSTHLNRLCSEDMRNQVKK